MSIPMNSNAESLPLNLPAAELVRPANHAGVAVENALTPLEILKWVFSFPAMMGALLVGRVFYEGRTFFVDPDLWWHVKNGQNILATHHWPTVDPYSSTVAGQPWMAYEWFGEIVLGTVARIGGLVGLDIFLIAFSSVVMLAIYWYATLRCGKSKAGFLSAGILCSLAFASFTLRPQMFGYLYLVATLILLELFRKGYQRAVWLLPPIFLLWVNTHGSWIIGLGVVFVTIAAGIWGFQMGSVTAKAWTQKQRIQLELAFLGSLAMLAITPYGTETVAYPFEVASKLPIGVANVLEWQPMPFNIVGGKLFLGLLLGFIAAQVLCKFEWRLEELALFLFGTMMACLHVRFVLIFVPFFAPMLAVIFARWFPRYEREKDKYVLNAALMAGVAAAMVWFMPTKATLEAKISSEYPTETTKYLAAHPFSGRLFNDYNFGGYLIGAGQKVFIDGRADPFERGGAFSVYLHISQMKPGSFTLLDQYQVTACLLQPDDSLATALASSPQWKKVASDKVSVLYVRELPAPQKTSQNATGKGD